MFKEYKISIQITDEDEARLQELCRRWEIYSGKMVSLEEMLQMTFETGDAIDHALNAMEHYYPDPSLKGWRTHDEYMQASNELNKNLTGILNYMKDHPDKRDEITDKLRACTSWPE